MISSRTYQKFSSNGLDLAELEPKPVDNRQIPTDSLLYNGLSLKYHFELLNNQTAMQGGFGFYNKKCLEASAVSIGSLAVLAIESSFGGGGRKISREQAVRTYVGDLSFSRQPFICY